MNITIHCGNDLNQEIVDTWQSICKTSVRFANPFFHPQFTRTVAEVLPGVRVATLEDSGKIIGFFPHQLEAAAGRGASVGRPVGGRLSDFQGLISNHRPPVDTAQLLEGCGLRQIRFDHWLDDQPLAGQRFDRLAESPFLDLSNGYQSYYQRRTGSSSTRLKKVGQLSRKLAREVGPLVFNPDDRDPTAWQMVIDWKSNQYRRTGALDIFQYSWVPNLIQKLTQTNENGFSGSVMTLRAGGRIAAVHAGIRTDRVVHWWFPAYDTQLSQYSPGLLMIT